MSCHITNQVKIQLNSNIYNVYLTEIAILYHYSILFIVYLYLRELNYALVLLNTNMLKWQCCNSNVLFFGANYAYLLNNSFYMYIFIVLLKTKNRVVQVDIYYDVT